MTFFAKAEVNGLPFGKLARGAIPINDLATLKEYLDLVHIKAGLLDHFGPDYPLVDLREMMPSFEPQFTEYKNLPGFSMIALGRRIDYQAEPFQFDLLPCPGDPDLEESDRTRVRSGPPVHGINQAATIVRSQLPEDLRDAFTTEFGGRDMTAMARYSQMMSYLIQMDRAHLIAPDEENVFRLRGVFASFPSHLDAVIKSFGRRIGKFAAHDNERYAENRQFVYKFLMETYGFPIASERRTSAALFASTLCRLKEAFVIKVQGQSDRTVTTLYHPDPRRLFPSVEKTALVALETVGRDTHDRLKKGRYYLDAKRRIALVRVTYQQRRYHAQNIIEDRALSVERQEIIHPRSGRIISDVNFLQDKTSLPLVLTDIVRGEHHGSIAYQDRETVSGTRAHSARLKFLSAWLEKHERRLVDYADETFDHVEGLLKGYILDPGNADSFKGRRHLLREVLARMVHLKQARTLRQLEQLVRQKTRGGRKMSYLNRYQAILDLLDENEDFLLSFYTVLFDKAMSLLDTVLADPYVNKRYLKLMGQGPSEYSRRIRETYQALAARRVSLSQRYHQSISQATLK
ncbi:MAG: hypothetical protein KJ621_07235 [Proteobacteria bacterium]|nr:hypothetical protein [Pseudomonadota bacterium]